MDNKRMTLADAETYTGFKRGYLYKLMHLGKIPYYKPTGGRAFFKQDELDAFLFRNRHAADYELAERADGILARAGTAR